MRKKQILVILGQEEKAGHQVHLLENSEFGDGASPLISNELFTFSRHNIGMIVGVALFPPPPPPPPPPKIELQLNELEIILIVGKYDQTKAMVSFSPS